MDIEGLIKPETGLEKAIIADDEFKQGCLYGIPRPGHPEGLVIFHIAEVLSNVNKYSSGNMRTDLRLIGIVHDTFKGKVDRTRPKVGDNHHAGIARKFAERYIENTGVLEVIETHDEAYQSWQQGAKKGNWNTAEERAKRLIQRINSYLDLYLTFYKCDNRTGDKCIDSYSWFMNIVRE